MANNLELYGPLRSVIEAPYTTGSASHPKYIFQPTPGTDTASDKYLPVPSVYSYELDDVSEPDAGRVENGYMYKKRIGQVFAVELEWWGLDSAMVAKILNAFQPEYLNVRLWDAKVGDFADCEMYVGNRTAPMYSATLNIWSNLKFKLIKRAC